MSNRHYLSELDISTGEFHQLLLRASELKAMRRSGDSPRTLRDKVLAMVFEKSSTRTRVSFATGMLQLGGHAIFLSPQDTHLGRGEPLEDTARVLSQMVDGVMIRTGGHDTLEKFASAASVPVINGLSDLLHPCQLLADMQTWREHRGDMTGKTVAWVGDGNNVCNSYVQTAHLLDFNLRVACPAGYEPDAGILQQCGNNTTIVRDAAAACENADLIVTDVWASMGQEQQQHTRAMDFSAYQITAELMALGRPDALFLHCLPAHRGEEVTAEVLEGPQSMVWEEAGNRLHSQKALLEMLLSSD